MLVLSQLIVVIRYLKPTPRGEQVEVEDIPAARRIVQTIEDGLIVPCVVEGSELRGVQKAPGSKAVARTKVSQLRGANVPGDGRRLARATQEGRRAGGGCHASQARAEPGGWDAVRG